MSININKTTLKHGLVLAPMAGFTDYAFRRICRERGAEYTVSEMVSAKALCYEQIGKKVDYKTAPLAAVKNEELPMAIQLFGSEPEFVSKAARMIESGEFHNYGKEYFDSVFGAFDRRSALKRSRKRHDRRNKKM